MCQKNVSNKFCVSFQYIPPTTILLLGFCYKREEEGGFFSINNDLIVLIKHARKIKRSCKAHKIVNSNRLLPDKRFANF